MTTALKKTAGIIFLIVIYIIFTAPVFSEDEEELQSLQEERTEILKFGIDSEVISLLEKLKDEEDPQLADIVAEIYKETLNNDLMEASVNYFIAVDYASAVDTAAMKIKNWEDEETEVLSSSLRYLSHYPEKGSEDLIMPLVEHSSKTLASAALTAIGKCGTEKSADILLDLLDDDDFTEELKPVIIKSLGEMKAEISVDILIEILEDIDEERSWRWNACEALGNIAHPDALEAIKNALNDDDTYLRANAVKALRYYKDAEVEQVLIQALRDSFWRVRVSAAEALGERKSRDAVDILVYKVKKDPENNVKIAAVEALGEIGTNDAIDFLRKLYEKATTPPSVRTKAAEIIISRDIAGSIESIKKVLANEWEKDSSPLLSYTCKFLSKAVNKELEPLFELMLGHNDVAIKIYGIRGIKLNKFSSMKEKLDQLSEEGNNRSVRREAISAAEEL